MRTHYKNGDEIGLKEIGCDGCSPAMINGQLCHEHGCPDSWKDYPLNCPWCGNEFYRQDREQMFCNDGCYADYHGLPFKEEG